MQISTMQQITHRRRFLIWMAGLPLVGSAVRAAVPLPPVRIALATAPGTIVVELYPAKAPVTVANFLKYIDQKIFAVANIYRVVPVEGAADYGVVQGGLGEKTVKRLPPIAHEPTTKTGLSHTDGAISMARRSPGTANSEFFFCLGDLTSFDADPKAAGDNKGFAAFGMVVEGKELLRKILVMPTSKTAGPPEMRGQYLKTAIAITSFKRRPIPIPVVVPPHDIAPLPPEPTPAPPVK
jgi:peptidyl-prolyl cis-trans isomerase A (cyclophilin A)